MEEFRIGKVHYTMDIQLTQDAYYNPRAAANAKIREYFIEGLDDYNSTDYPHARTAGVPVINWASFGAAPVTSDYRSANYRLFSQLSDRSDRPYCRPSDICRCSTSASTAIKHLTIYGVPSQQPWIPDWVGASNVIEFIQVDGLNDKYILMPKAVCGCAAGCQPGTPSTATEKVGTYIDRA
jgi:hypothetical protein